MSSMLSYKGYHSRVEFNLEDKVLFGKIEGISDLVTYESESAALIEEEFKAAVDDYLAFCKEVGKEPDKEYSGTFNIRISPDTHKELALYSFRNNTTINASVDAAITEMLAKEMIGSQFVQDTMKLSGRGSIQSGIADWRNPVPKKIISFKEVANG